MYVSGMTTTILECAYFWNSSCNSIHYPKIIVLIVIYFSQTENVLL